LIDWNLAINDILNKISELAYGKKDNRAPVMAFIKWLKMDNIIYDELDGGHEICNTPLAN